MLSMFSTMNILMMIYWVILLLLVVLTLRNMCRERDVFWQFEAFLALIPFVLRLLLIK